MNHDRFFGEADEAPAVGHCQYCGSLIHQGNICYEYDDKTICDGCARRFAWHEFESISKKHVAGPGHWL